MSYFWNLKRPNKEKVDFLSAELSISKILSELLVSRDVINKDDASLFFNPSLDKLPSPFLMKGMEATTNRLIKAIESGEKIVIYGDFDCDGITSTTILYNFLSSIEASVSFYIPERIKEGYGMNFDSIKGLADNGATLILSTDCGISENVLIDKCKTLDLDFIITDHHTVPNDIPNAFSIVNPKQLDCEYPFKEICAAGVAFNLIMALRYKLREIGYFEFIKEPNLARDLDLVAVGTIADSMPIVGVNRIFVYNGLKEIPVSNKKGLLALLKKNKKNYSTRDVSFEIAPKINATGRVGSASNAVKLLIEKEDSKIDSLLAIIEQDNSKRRVIQEKVASEALILAEKVLSEKPEKASLVLYSEDWHPGVIGIVASRIVEKYNRPCAIISIKDEIGKGSLRTANNINLFTILENCATSLMQFGGHSGAAGLTISIDKIEIFQETFEDSVKEYDCSFEERLEVDAEINLGDIDTKFLNEIKRMEPFGKGNPNPLFVTNKVVVKSKKILKDKHLELTISKDGATKRALWFNYRENVALNTEIDLVYSIQRDTYNGSTSITLFVQDLRVA